MSTLLFAPAAYNLAETTRMLEIAKACRDKFTCNFLTYGGQFEHLIEKAGFNINRLEPHLTPEKIEHLYKVDKGEKLGVMFTEAEAAARVTSELDLYERLKPAAVITGFSLTVPLSTRISGVPLVWVIQSTWLPESGMGFIDPNLPRPLKALLSGLIVGAAAVFGRLVMLNPLNRVGKRYGVRPIASVFEFWRGNHTLLAEPPEFSGLTQLPPDHHYIGPLIAREDYPIPPEIENIPRDLPLVYFAMGSSGTPEIIARLLQGFAGAPYRVIAPVKAHIEKLDVHLPENVIVTSWLPAHKVNPMVDISVIHGGIGTVMTAALAGKPVVGVGMQPEQDANLNCLVRKGFAIRIPKGRADANKLLAAVDKLYHDEKAKQNAKKFAEIVAQWDGPRRAAEFLEGEFGDHDV
ncbi:MAG: glycosyltransferase family 1 protein [Anaerolineae bacterium]|nr:glycosyltransferase family 1 protein [Anaerolineae bacterium]